MPAAQATAPTTQETEDAKIHALIRQYSAYLPKCSYQDAIRVYANILDAIKHGDVPRWMLAELCKHDRYLLLVEVLNAHYLLHPWLYERCREVEADPDGWLDLWSRSHGKSSIITFGGSFQEIIRDPEITICILSNDRPVAKKFLKQIKGECETNQKLHELWPHIFWAHPAKESPLWSMDDGLILQRRGNPREPTLYACGLVDSQPTGSHFRLRIYDDTVTEDSVGTPEMIQKTTDRYDLSQSLGVVEIEGGEKNRQWMAGTRYHFADSYAQIKARGVIKMRVYPATDDGSFDGRPVLLTPEAWERIKQGESRHIVACQRLLNPLAGDQREFLPEWIQRWEVRPARLNVCITVDPANSRKSGSCNSAFCVQGVDALGNWYLLDGALHKMSLKDRWEMLYYLWMRWSRAPGVLSCYVGYERYGLQADIDYFQQEMLRLPLGRKVSIPIDEVNWVSDGPQAKDDRIRRLAPDFQKRKYFFPYDSSKNITSAMLSATDAGRPYLIAKPIRRIDEHGKVYDLVTKFIDNEYDFFPATNWKDFFDAMSRRFELPIAPPSQKVYGAADLVPPGAGET